MNSLMDSDVVEVYRFLAPVCLTISNGRFQNIDQNNIWESDCIKDLISSKIPADIGFWRQVSEDVGSLSLYLAGSNRREHFAELSKDKNHLQHCCDNLSGILDILREIESRYPTCMFLENVFNGTKGVSYIKGEFVGDGRFPKLNIWKRNLPDVLFTQIQNCLNNNTDWKKSISDIRIAYGIAFPLIINLLKDSQPHLPH